MIKITVNKGKVNIELNGKEEMVLAEIILAVHKIGYCLYNLRAKYNFSDEVFEFTKNAALLAFVDGCNGTDLAERYADEW